MKITILFRLPVATVCILEVTGIVTSMQFVFPQILLALERTLRQTAEANFVLHAIRIDSGEHRSYRVDRMQGASATSQVTRWN